MALYPIPIEDVEQRDPEWQELEPGYGHEKIMRKIEWDPVHDQVRSDGPTVVIHEPDRPL